jgi:hypothetical protein
MAQKLSKQVINTLQQLSHSGELDDMSKNELRELMTHLNIVLHEVSLRVEKKGDRAYAPASESRGPVGILSRLVHSWSNDISNLPR